MRTNREQELRFVCEQLSDIIHHIWDSIPDEDKDNIDRDLKLLEEVLNRVDLTKEIT